MLIHQIYRVSAFLAIKDMYHLPDSPTTPLSSLHTASHPFAYRSSAIRSPEVAIHRRSRDSYSRNIAAWPFLHSKAIHFKILSGLSVDHYRTLYLDSTSQQIVANITGNYKKIYIKCADPFASHNQGWNDLNHLIKINDLNREFD